MHVAFVITRGDAVGGATVHVRDMARYLLDRGNRATVLVGEAPGERRNDAIAELRRYNIPCLAVAPACAGRFIRCTTSQRCAN